MHISNKLTHENLDAAFTYQPASEDQQRRYAAIREAGIAFARAILDGVPDCADRSAALRSVREARMWANAAIALEEC